jgi:hypothetical protein
MKPINLDLFGRFLNYEIYVYLFLRALQLNSLMLFDSIIALVGLIASILIFIYNHFINDNE